MRVNTLYSTKEIVTEQGRRMELRYYLIQDIRSLMKFRRKDEHENTTEKQSQEDLTAGDRITYGVRIVKTEDGQEEQECLSGLSVSMEAVECLLWQLIHGLVTPMAAVSVVDDWVSAQ